MQATEASHPSLALGYCIVMTFCYQSGIRIPRIMLGICSRRGLAVPS